MKEFKRGDKREDGKVFWGKSKTCENGQYWITKEKYTALNENKRKSYNKQVCTKTGHLKKNLSLIKGRAKKQNIPFDLDYAYLASIAPDICPVLGIPLSWGERKGIPTDNSPSLDKFIPHLGYIKGNVAWISYRANVIKNNATQEEVQAVATWMKNNNKNGIAN